MLSTNGGEKKKEINTQGNCCLLGIAGLSLDAWVQGQIMDSRADHCMYLQL